MRRGRHMVSVLIGRSMNDYSDGTQDDITHHIGFRKRTGRNTRKTKKTRTKQRGNENKKEKESKLRGDKILRSLMI
jgi:hypothetical protein